VSELFVLVQLSDFHVGADWGAGDPAGGVRAAVDAVRELRPGPDAVLVTGDLVEHGTDAEYAAVGELLAPLAGVPLLVLPGNHDDRAALRRHFDVPGEGAEPVQYAVTLGPLRVVVLDSTIPGADAGRLDAPRLAWLDAVLAEEPARPTLIALHHPPLRTGSAAWDALGVPDAERRALAEVVARHPQVRRIAGGHVHRPVVAELAGRPVVSAPSTYLQARFDLGAQELDVVPDPSGFAVHVVAGDELITHLHPLGSPV
jgi:3',5'-cyclic AMP phosphodiesterase CpdA